MESNPTGVYINDHDVYLSSDTRIWWRQCTCWHWYFRMLGISFYISIDWYISDGAI